MLGNTHIFSDYIAGSFLGARRAVGSFCNSGYLSDYNFQPPEKWEAFAKKWTIPSHDVALVFRRLQDWMGQEALVVFCCDLSSRARSKGPFGLMSTIFSKNMCTNETMIFQIHFAVPEVSHDSGLWVVSGEGSGRGGSKICTQWLQHEDECYKPTASLCEVVCLQWLLGWDRQLIRCPWAWLGSWRSFGQMVESVQKVRYIQDLQWRMLFYCIYA